MGFVYPVLNTIPGLTRTLQKNLLPLRPSWGCHFTFHHMFSEFNLLTASSNNLGSSFSLKLMSACKVMNCPFASVKQNYRKTVVCCFWVFFNLLHILLHINKIIYQETFHNFLMKNTSHISLHIECE